MKIVRNCVASFHYRLRNEAGEELEQSYGSEPTDFLCGRGNIMPGLEKVMLGREAGDNFSVTLRPEEAYGRRREDSLQRVPIKHLLNKGKIRPGQAVSVQTSRGVRDVVVVKVGKFNVDVDTNHPLAGQSLIFEIEILDVREATDEELAHGHAHGVGGHHHP